MMALENYEPVEETAHLVRSPRNAQRLREADAQLRQGRGTEAPVARMRIVFAYRGWEDFTYWVETDRKMAARIVRLIKDTERDPFERPGKPEPSGTT